MPVPVFTLQRIVILDVLHYDANIIKENNGRETFKD